MIRQEVVRSKLEHFLKQKGADKTGIVFFRTKLQASRFANSQIHQHLQDEDQTIYFRVLIDGRLGVASTNSLDENNLKATFDKALHIARLRLETKEKKDIPLFKGLKNIPGCYDQKTAKMPALTRAKILQKIFKDADALQIKFSGNFYNGLTQVAVFSPEGKMNYQDYSFAGIKLIAAAQGSSGYASAINYNADMLNPHALSDIAVKKCLDGLKKVTLEPGKYDVILEPDAVAELLAWLNYIGFGAKTVFEESSFLYNKYARKITGENVNIYDYGKDKSTFILPFDFEGLPRDKAYLIKSGRAQKPLCDSYYAKLLKMKANGRANFPDDTDGPLGYNLVMEGGSGEKDKIIKSAKRAILITRFHYINGYLNTRRAVMTGMTRDGTFLIEDGRIKSAVKDMRFTESILEAFSRIKYISRERKIVADPLESLCAVCAPTLYIKGFNFIS